MMVFILTVDGGEDRRYGSKQSAVRAGKREAKQMFRVYEETPYGVSCVHAWDAPREGRP